MSKPWGGIGSWAAAAEAEDEELAAAATATATANASSDPQSFPSLREAVTAKPKKKKNVMSLSVFYGTGSTNRGSASGERQGLTPVEMMQLPTGPKQRSPDELYAGNRLGGGFSNYGGRFSGGPTRERDGDSEGQWGGRRSYGDDRQGPPRRGSDYDLQPSRADEVDDWGARKRSVAPPTMDSGRANRYESLGGGSRADEVDSWSIGKKPVEAAPPARSGTFGSSYRDSGRPRLVLDPPRGDNAAKEPPQPPMAVEKTSKPNPFGTGRPREEILAEKGFGYKKLDMEIEAKKSVSSGPTSPQGSRPSSAHSSRSESTGVGSDNGARPKPRVNPFGNAKPREVVLEEKGQDWRKMDQKLEHRVVDRPETEEEKKLKEEIEHLKNELHKEVPTDDDSQEPGADQANLDDLIQLKERDLENLSRELDEKARMSQKAVERPGSGAGRSGSFLERPPSQSRYVDDARNVDSAGGPRSRGTGDLWSRPGEDRRGSFHGGRDRGFLTGGDFDRSGPRQRW